VKRIVLAVAVALAALAAVALAETLKPDPNRQAGADGCKRDTTAIYTGMAPNWVYVNDKDAPASGPPPAPQWASGRIESKTLPYLAARIASSDDPITHRSYDFNIDLKVDPAYDALTGTSRDETTAAGSDPPRARDRLLPDVRVARRRRPRDGARLLGLGLRPLRRAR